MTRELLPERRASFTQSIHMGGQGFHLGFGEYPDGRLGEIFINANKTGTFVRGVLDALARMASLALQHGIPTKEVAEIMRGLNFPPHGPVEGSPTCSGAVSVADWIGQEIEAFYVPKEVNHATSD